MRERRRSGCGDGDRQVDEPPREDVRVVANAGVSAPAAATRSATLGPNSSSAANVRTKDGGMTARSRSDARSTSSTEASIAR